MLEDPYILITLPNTYEMRVCSLLLLPIGRETQRHDQPQELYGAFSGSSLQQSTCKYSIVWNRVVAVPNHYQHIGMK